MHQRRDRKQLKTHASKDPRRPLHELVFVFLSILCDNALPVEDEDAEQVQALEPAHEAHVFSVIATIV